MFLKGIKRKSAQKYIDKELKAGRKVDATKIKTIGILVDARVFNDFPFLNELSTVFGITKESIQLLYYHPNKKIAQTLTIPVYTDNELGFKGELKNEFVTNFIATEFDALLNYYSTDEQLLQLVSVQSKAKFKIGFSEENEQLNDFSIAVDLHNVKTLTFELKKYLSILNKI